MKQQTKLDSREAQQERQQSDTRQAQQTSPLEFATPEELLRHDALHTPVPPTIAPRLQESISKGPAQARPWWKRLLGGSNQ